MLLRNVEFWELQNLEITNLGTNLYQAIDAASLFTSVRIKGSDVSTVLIGTNDHIYYTTDADKRQVFKDALRSIIWWGAVPDKQKVRMQNVQLTAPPPTLLRAPTLLTNAGTSPLWGWSNLSGNYQGLPNYGDTGGGGNLGILSITSGAGVSMTLTGIASPSFTSVPSVKMIFSTNASTTSSGWFRYATRFCPLNSI